MTKRLTIALVAVALFVLMAVMPVSAAALFANGTIINQGATIFIGEEGLNVTHAMNQAYYRGTGAGTPGTPIQNTARSAGGHRQQTSSTLRLQRKSTSAAGTMTSLSLP